jgi:hypothetical protein
MTALRAAVVALGIGLAAPAHAAVIHGLVYADTSGDGAPSAGERGVPGAVVAFNAHVFAITDASGQFDLNVPDTSAKPGILWPRPAR